MNLGRDFCVTFDLWETILMDQPELDLTRGRLRCERLHEALSELGINLSLSGIRRGYQESAPWFQAAWGRNENLSTMEQIRLILQAASKKSVALPQEPSAVEMLHKAYVDPIFEAPPRLNQDAVPTLEGMRGRARKIGLISNTGRSPGATLRKLMSKLGLTEFFDGTIFSDEVGSRKPDRGIFEAAAKELQTDLAKIIHIGDDPEADAWGAKQAGMRALLFEYPVPEGFKRLPSSLFALSRADRRIENSEIKPDGRIIFLKEALKFVDSMMGLER